MAGVRERFLGDLCAGLKAENRKYPPHINLKKSDKVFYKPAVTGKGEGGQGKSCRSTGNSSTKLKEAFSISHDCKL